MTGGGFVAGGRPAQVAAVLVTYNNEADIDAAIASLREQVGDLTLRVIVVDNGSRDSTVDLVARHVDVALLRDTNRGFAAGINRAMSVVDPADAVLVLNPDTVLRPRALAAMWQALRDPQVGAVVPRLVDTRGRLSYSLRREPTVLRSLGDALLGAHWPDRPSWLGEIVYDRPAYERAGVIDWATGAAVLVDRELWRRVGEWDEQFFLYSEETDFLRRVRLAGSRVAYEPEAVVVHRGGGSGRSSALETLLTVNRVRYHRKHHGPAAAAVMRSVLLLQAVLRCRRPGAAGIIRALLRSGTWSALPHAGGAAVRPVSPASHAA